MKLEQKIGVVGNGFVGAAVKFGFSPQVGCDAEVKVYDKNPSKSTDRLIDADGENLDGSMFIFLRDTGISIPNNPATIIFKTIEIEIINNHNNTNNLEFLIIIDFSFSGAFCFTTSVK